MNALARLVGAVLRSRYGLAAVLILLVVGAVGTGALINRGAPGEPNDGQLPPIVTADPSAGDDGLSSPDPVTTLAPVAGAGPSQRALWFARAWLRRDEAAEAWRSGLRPHSTADLTERMALADPVSVPVAKPAGDTAVAPLNDTLVEVTVPTDTGELKLRLVTAGGKWLVDGVDWEPR
ncbi:hypothetical protein [Pilimelia columellifera]|uniref:Uncharacterized protein n=1 Tax=Pilimelia columellifera subsp. columellifera TaxID=706583 RepID=A0ABN3NCI6_9ACTN